MRKRKEQSTTAKHRSASLTNENLPSSNNSVQSSNIPQNQGQIDFSKEEDRAIKEILDHALQFNNKAKIDDLNLLDVLNSYDTLIKNFNFGCKESGSKIYRKLLQIQRENQPRQPLQEKNIENISSQMNQQYTQQFQSVPNSDLTTLNQDLQFDFQGSFGNYGSAAAASAYMTNSQKAQSKHKRSKSKQSNSTIKNSTLAPPSVSKIPRPPPSMLNSQFQSLAQTNQNQNTVQNSINNYQFPHSGSQQNLFKLDSQSNDPSYYYQQSQSSYVINANQQNQTIDQLMSQRLNSQYNGSTISPYGLNSNIEETHRSNPSNLVQSQAEEIKSQGFKITGLNSNSNFSTLQQPSCDSSRPDSTRIKLPKLSFNDLVQQQPVQQDRLSTGSNLNQEGNLKKWQTSHRDYQPDHEVIKEVDEELNQTEELKSEDMSAFHNSHLHDDSSLMKYSNRPSNHYQFDKNRTSNFRGNDSNKLLPFEESKNYTCNRPQMIQNDYQTYYESQEQTLQTTNSLDEEVQSLAMRFPKLKLISDPESIQDCEMFNNPQAEQSMNSSQQYQSIGGQTSSSQGTRNQIKKELNKTQILNQQKPALPLPQKQPNDYFSFQRIDFNQQEQFSQTSSSNIQTNIQIEQPRILNQELNHVRENSNSKVAIPQQSYFTQQVQYPAKIDYAQELKKKRKVKENAIDSNNKIAYGFALKKLQQKAWRSWLIVKMHKIHQSHLNRLAKSYRISQQQQKYFKKFKFFTKVLLPQQRKNIISRNHYQRKLLLKVFQSYRERAQEGQMIRAKFVSTKLVLRSQRLRLLFSTWKNANLKIQVRKAQLTTSLHISQQKIKQKAFRAFFIYARACRQHRIRIMKEKLSYQMALKMKAIQAFQQNIQMQRQKRRKIVKARTYYRNNFAQTLKHRAFYILQQYYQGQKQLKKAIYQRDFWIMKRFFKIVNINTILRAGKKTQIRFVERYRQNRNIVQAFKAFCQNTQLEKERAQMIQAFIRKLKMRKLFREIVKSQNRRMLWESAQNGPFLFAAQQWLELSFSHLMSNIWREFPSQRIERDPLTDHRLQIINYIGISKNPRYRQYFYEANYNLRRFLLTKCMRGLHGYSQQVSSLRKKKKNEFIATYFRALKKQTERQSIIRSLMKNKFQKRNLLTKVSVFQALKCYKRSQKHMKRAFTKVKRLQKKKLLLHHFDKWYTKLEKIRTIQSNDKIADSAYRQRHLNMTLALWLKRLHLKLKVKHLNEQKEMFQKTRIRRKFLRTWRINTEKSKYLSEQEKNIAQNQINITLYNCFKSLQKNTRDQQNQKQMEQAAKQEYQYWLGKRVILSLKQGFSNMKNQNQLFEYLSQDYLRKVQQKVIRNLQMFTRFRQERKYQDALMTQNIIMIRRKTLFNLWQKTNKRNMSLHLLNKTFTFTQLRTSFNQINHINAFKESVLEIMKEKRLTYILLSAFNNLRRNRKQIKTHKEINFLINHRTVSNQKKSSFNHWLKLYQARRKCYTQYAFTVIQIKNQLLKSMWTDWKSFAQFQKLKKASQKYRLGKLKRNIFKNIKLFYLKNYKNVAALDYIRQANRIQNKTKIFQLWRSKFLNKNMLKQRMIQFTQKRIRMMFDVINENKLSRKVQRVQFEQKKQILSKKIKQCEYKRFRRVTKQTQYFKQQSNNARQFHLSYLYQQVFKSWQRDYYLKAEEIKKFMKIKGKHQKIVNKNLFNLWIVRSQKSLNKVRSIRKLNTIKSKKLQKKRFIQWVDQTNFLITLEQRTEQFIAHCQQKQMKQGLQRLAQVSQENKIYRRRMRDIKKYSIQKIQLRMISNWINFTHQRRFKNYRDKQAFDHYNKQMKSRYIGIFRITCKQLRRIRIGNKKFLNKQKAIFAPAVFEKFLDNMKSKKSVKTMIQYAQDFKNSTMCNKVLKVIYQYSLKKTSRKIVKQQAVSHYCKTLLAKALKNILVFKFDHQILTNKRKLMHQLIQHIDRQVNLRQALGQLQAHTNISKEETFQSQYLIRILKMGRLFSTLQFHSQLKNEQRAKYEILSNAIKLKAKANHYLVWRKLFINEKTIQQLSQQRKRFMKLRVFSDMRKRYENFRKLNDFQKTKRTLTKSLIIQILCGYNNYRKETLNQIYQASFLFKKHLKMRVFNGFERMQERNQLIYQGMKNRSFYLKLRVFQSYRLIKQRDLLCNEMKESHMINDKRIIFISWINKLNKRYAIKDKLLNIVKSYEKDEVYQKFTQWKRGTYFMKMCELIYQYQYKEEQESKIKQCFMSWRQLQIKRAITKYNSDILQQNVKQQQVQRIFINWKMNDNIKGRVLLAKLSKLIYPVLQESINNLTKYSQKEKFLVQQSQKLVQNKEKIEKRQFFYQWLILYEQKSQLKLLEVSRKQILMKRALRSLEENRLKEIQNKYQMLRIIQFFGERRPEMLLSFSQSFLSLNTQYCEENRLCSTALAKYVIEKWKNVKEKVRECNQTRQQADQLYNYNQAKRTIDNWKQAFQLKQSKNVYKQSCFEFYAVRLIGRALQGMRDFAYIAQKKRHLKSIETQVLKIKCEHIFKNTFTTWREKFFQDNRLRAAYEYIISKREQDLKKNTFHLIRVFTSYERSVKEQYDQARLHLQHKKKEHELKRIFSTLKRYTRQKKSKISQQKQQLQLARQLYDRNLSKRIFNSLKKEVKDIQIKNKYSRLYTIFVAWKFHIKEKVILEKYLNECNYKSDNLAKSKNQKRSYSKENEVFGQTYKTLEQSKNNNRYGGMNRQMSKGILREIDNNEYNQNELITLQSEKDKNSNYGLDSQMGSITLQQSKFTPTLAEPLNKQIPKKKAVIFSNPNTINTISSKGEYGSYRPTQENSYRFNTFRSQR